MATTFEAGIATGWAVAKGVRSTSNPAERDPDLDITFDCNGYDRDGDPGQGIGVAWAIASGGKSGTMGDDLAIATAYGIASGSDIVGNVFSGGATCYALAYGDLLLEGSKSNWAMWSKIGSMDFTIDSTNEAGKMPIDGLGTIYELRKLKNSIVAYGRNSIQVLRASDVLWGSNRIMSLGIKNKGAVTSDGDIVHWFIDSQNNMWELGDSLKKLGYSGLFEDMSNLVMYYSNMDRLVYICDGSTGYVYNHDVGCMAEGPATLSGISYAGGVNNVVASSDIEMPSFRFLSDIVDFNSRKEKTITSLEFATNIMTGLGVRIHWRKDYVHEFIATPWTTVQRDGVAHVRCYGVEFKFEFKSTYYEQFKFIDYMKINGVFHNFNFYLDMVRSKGY